MLAERSAASAAEAGVPRAVAGLSTEPLTVGSTIFVDLPEHGISAGFTVSAILPCPTPNPGDGYLVTTKFIHENAEILDLRIEGSADVIGTTASHPFWSEDRQQFIAAGDLRVGENLRLADDTTRKVESLTRRETRETVYNIEVDGEHVFYVGEDGVLVHNTCDWRMWEKQAGKYFRRKGFDVVGSIRNASGHGIDMVLRNRKTGQIFIAEVKSRTRGWGGLSNLQRKGAEANARRILDALGNGHWAPHNQLPGSGTVADVLRDAISDKNFGGGFFVRINEGLRGLREIPWLP
jgi:Holliday junction resolvase-like predicted endonuclease